MSCCRQLREIMRRPEDPRFLFEKLPYVSKTFRQTSESFPTGINLFPILSKNFAAKPNVFRFLQLGTAAERCRNSFVTPFGAAYMANNHRLNIGLSFFLRTSRLRSSNLRPGSGGVRGARARAFSIADGFGRGRIARPSPQISIDRWLLSAPHPPHRGAFPASRRREPRWPPAARPRSRITLRRRPLLPDRRFRGCGRRSDRRSRGWRARSGRSSRNWP
jgi:hypothetical protein